MKSFLGRHKKLIGIILIALIILGIIFWPHPSKLIETQQVSNGDITQGISATGSVAADNAVDLTFIVGGKLVYLGVKKGDTVKAGQTIAVLDQRTFQKNLEQALLNYSVERNTFEQGRYDNNAPTPYDAVSQDIQYLLQTNQFNLNNSVVSVELQAIAKEQSVLTTPINGIVTRADVTTNGVNISPTTTFGITDPSSMVFEVEVDEADIGRIKVGDTMHLTLDAYPDDIMNLHVDEIDFSSEKSETGGTIFNVKAKLPSNEGYKYRVGMNGDAEIVIAQKYNVPILSIASLTDDNAVYVKTGETFEKRKVQTGIQSDTEVEITSGLKEGEEVALQPDDAAEQVKTSTKRFFFF